MKIRLLCTCVLAGLLGGACTSEVDYTAFVDTSIGAIDSRGSNCVIGPQLPYGSINPSPQTEAGGTDGYHPKRPIRGFGQLHVSGTGWSSYGHFLISPRTGLETGLTAHDSPHSGDVTRPHYYRTQLDRYGIGVEVAPSHYSAIYRFAFPQSDESVLLFDASHSVVGDIATYMTGHVLENRVAVDTAAREVRMMIRFQGGWPEGAYDLYCLGRYDAEATEAGIWEGDRITAGAAELAADNPETHCGAYLKFRTDGAKPVQLKVALSFRSFEQAAGFLEQEIPGFDFDGVAARGKAAWNEKLSRAAVESYDAREQTIFYSALYRVFTLARDRSADTPYTPGVPFWDDNYAFWDTFRTAYPLLTLIDTEAVRDNIRALIERFDRNGEVCDGFVAGRDRHNEQGGNDVDHVIVDAFLKGVEGVDWEAAYRIVRHNADQRRIGYIPGPERAANPAEAYRYKEQGWIPNRAMSSSQTLEFAYNDYSAALMAQALDYEADGLRYLERSRQWVQLWNPELENRGYTGFIDARNADGTFAFIPADRVGGSWNTPFYEGSSWTYSYYVPHDFDRLIALMGGREQFVERLEHGFRNELVSYSNEPGFLATCAFTHAGRPDRTSYWMHDTMDKGFDLEGYPGNDDTGSMGSWYVFGSLGLFPSAGQDFYYLNAPRCVAATLRLQNGKKLKITSNAAPGRVYIRSVKLNGQAWTSPYLRHADIAQGGTLEFDLTDCAPER